MEIYTDVGDICSRYEISDGDRDDETVPVKIAIIDTSIHSTFVERKCEYKDLVETDCHCWEDKLNDCQDAPLAPEAFSTSSMYSHGETSVEIVRKVHSNVHIHVARAFRRKEADADTPELVANVGTHMKSQHMNCLKVPGPGRLGPSRMVMTMFATRPNCRPDMYYNPRPFRDDNKFCNPGCGC